MNRRQLVVVGIVILLVVVALAASIGTLLATTPTEEATYKAPASAAVSYTHLTLPTIYSV